MVNDVVPRAQLMERALQLARAIAANPAGAVELSLAVLRAAAAMTEAHLQHLSEQNLAVALASDGFREGCAAFLEKRQADFSSTSVTGEGHVQAGRVFEKKA